MNDSTIIKGNQYDHGSITFKLGDVDISGGVKEIKYGWKRTRGSLRGASAFRRARTRGVVDFEGSIVLYKYMFDLLVDTFGEGWAELGMTITAQYGNDDQPVRVDTLIDVEFNSTDGGSSEGEEPNEVTLELDIMDLLYNGKRPIKRKKLSMEAINNSIENDEIEELIPAADLEKLRASGERLNYCVVDTWEGPAAVVFRNMTPSQRERAEGMFDDEKRKKLLAKTVFKDVIVYPEGKARAELLEELPGLPDQVATLALGISRGNRAEEAKKLMPSSRVPAAVTKASSSAG